METSQSWWQIKKLYQIYKNDGCEWDVCGHIESEHESHADEGGVWDAEGHAEDGHAAQEDGHVCHEERVDPRKFREPANQNPH